MKYIKTKDGDVCPNCYHPALECRRVDSRPAACSPRPIGDIGNDYGGLSVKTENGKHFWSIENYDGDSWDEITAELFDALNAFEDSKANSELCQP
tara:strand:+ start:595 stop:879 length:285 start_codon:yes stop_codon:yes gene_type:complete